MVEIVAVESKTQLRDFIDFPHDLYRGDSNYVSELFLGQQDLLSKDKHPFYKHSKAQSYLAYKGGVLCGRILAIWNTNYNSFVNATEGHFGFFDCVEDKEVANALLGQAEQWIREQGGNRMMGPINLTTNDTCGLLVEGFDSPPVAMMTYNFPYYQDLIEAYGLRKKEDLRAYMVETETVDGRALLLMDRLEERLKRSGIILRELNLKDFKNEARKIRDVYNKAWDQNIGFVPMTDEEFNHTAKDLKMIVNPQYAIVAEKEGEIVAFALGVPDINQVLIKIKRGRLFPTGIFKLLFGRKKIDLIRVLMLGVLEPYRKLGIEACLYGRIIRNGRKNNLKGAECSWMLDSNYLMNHAIEQINGKLYKKYRLFEKAV